MISKTRDTSKYCEFHQAYGHDTNAYRELKSQIEEVVRSRKLAYLIKGIRKGKAKQTDNQLEDWIAPTVKAEPATEGREEPILMIGVVNNPSKRKEPPKTRSIEEMIFPPIRNRAPSVDPILISVQVYGRHVGRVLLDGGVAYDIKYEHCFLKLRKDIRERMRDIYTTMSRFSGEQVSPLGEISLLITIGEAPHHRNEQITFLIVRSGSPNNMLLKRTEIVGLGMIPSMMHSAVLYQSEAGPKVIMSEYQDVRRCELVKRLKEAPPKTSLQVAECSNSEEKNHNQFEYSDMTGIPRTLKIRGTNFATEHKLNEDKKITPVQQKKRRMAPERAIAASKEVEELRRA
ncbi:hypothetical protein Tco_0823977 [Tanacetum coccineum]|uniref:Reverse transcriptase domain-containing protein n=1 Tax=Tanacetum coccineum TaxID=301880 RepID=A0ABQ5ANU1_9ASTR